MRNKPVEIAESKPAHENRLEMVKEMRIGRIEISKEFIECARGDAWDIIMRNVRILEAKMDIFRGCILYDCYSPWFDAQEGKAIGAEIPTYQVKFRRDEKTGEAILDGVNLVKTHTEYVDDDNVLERLKRTIREAL